MFEFIVPIIGIVAGIIAVITLPQGKRDPGGAIIPVILGLIGAFGGGYLARAFMPGATQNIGREPYQLGFIEGIVGAVVGAALLLIIYRIVTRKTTAE